MEQYISGAEAEARAERERRERGVTFRELAAEYLVWLEDVKGAKPATLADHRHLLAEPGTPWLRGGVGERRGHGGAVGYIMSAIGDKAAASITVRDVEALLATISKTGASPRTVNKHRAVLSAAFNYGMRGATFGLPSNPAKEADKRREPSPGVLAYYRPEDIEAVARAFAIVDRRDRSGDLDPAQDAEAVRVSAAAMDVPQPQNGSSTTSPSFDDAAMIRSKSA